MQLLSYKHQNAKWGATPESEDENDTGKQNDCKGLTCMLKLFDPLKSSTQSNKVSISNSLSSSRPEYNKVCAEPCATSSLGKRTPREQMFQQKREITEKKAKLESKKVQEAEFISKIERSLV